MKYALICAVGLVLSTVSRAQESQPAKPTATEEETNQRFWQAQLPGGGYVVALDRLCSVGKHEYLVDGGYLVTEVTIDTQGAVVARFYHGELYRPDTGLASGQALLDKVHETAAMARQRGGIEQTSRLVVKNYPATTHAKTVEFQILRKENLEALYRSVNKAWMTGKGVRFKIQDD